MPLPLANSASPPPSCSSLLSSVRSGEHLPSLLRRSSEFRRPRPVLRPRPRRAPLAPLPGGARRPRAAPRSRALDLLRPPARLCLRPLLCPARRPASSTLGKKAAPRRGSWVLASPKVVRPTALDFGDRTPVKERPSPARSSASVRKSTSVMPGMVSRRKSFAADRGDPPPSKIPRIAFPAEKSKLNALGKVLDQIRFMSSTDKSKLDAHSRVVY